MPRDIIKNEKTYLSNTAQTIPENSPALVLRKRSSIRQSSRLGLRQRFVQWERIRCRQTQNLNLLSLLDLRERPDKTCNKRKQDGRVTKHRPTQSVMHKPQVIESSDRKTPDSREPIDIETLSAKCSGRHRAGDVVYRRRAL